MRSGMVPGPAGIDPEVRSGHVWGAAPGTPSGQWR